MCHMLHAAKDCICTVSEFLSTAKRSIVRCPGINWILQLWSVIGVRLIDIVHSECVGLTAVCVIASLIISLSVWNESDRYCWSTAKRVKARSTLVTRYFLDSNSVSRNEKMRLCQAKKCSLIPRFFWPPEATDHNICVIRYVVLRHISRYMKTSLSLTATTVSDSSRCTVYKLWTISQESLQISSHRFVVRSGLSVFRRICARTMHHKHGWDQ